MVSSGTMYSLWFLVTCFLWSVGWLRHRAWWAISRCTRSENCDLDPKRSSSGIPSSVGQRRSWSVLWWWQLRWQKEGWTVAEKSELCMCIILLHFKSDYFKLIILMVMIIILKVILYLYNTVLVCVQVCLYLWGAVCLDQHNTCF